MQNETCAGGVCYQGPYLPFHKKTMLTRLQPRRIFEHPETTVKLVWSELKEEDMSC